MDMKPLTTTVSFLVFITLTGCATIVGQPDQNISVRSTPSNAEVTITDETGSRVFTGTTPTNVTLQKSDGSYWGGKEYKVIVDKEGYSEQRISITANPNGWYIAGNFVFGGLIGWFIVDPLNGDMYTLSPEIVNADLGGQGSANSSITENSIKIVLIQDVPTHLRDDMVPLN